MRRLHFLVASALLAVCSAQAFGDPVFVNGLRLRGSRVDATGQPGANEGRLGFFSDLYYDPVREEWWALSDRGPGGGVLAYETRVQQIELDVNYWSGRISHFGVVKTVKFTDPYGLLSPPMAPVARRRALNGLNPLALNLDASELGRSLDPEGFVVDPRTGHFLVSDEYGPSIYEFDRMGRLVFVFETPENLIPRLADNVTVDYVAGRGATGIFFGRQDNRGFEGLAITPDGRKVVAVLQDPLVNEPGANSGRDGRNVRVVVFDNDHRSFRFGTSIAQYAYQLEKQADVLGRIVAAFGTGSSTNPRQGRNIGLSAIVALNDRQFLVLERDNRGLGVDNPVGKTGELGVVGSKRVYRIDLAGATDVTSLALPIGDLPSGIVPVTKSSEATPFIDLTAHSVLPNREQAEKWEGLTIGPRLIYGQRVIVAGNDNDYSVTQLEGSDAQYDTYVDFNGKYARCVLGAETQCQLQGSGAFDQPLPDGLVLIPGVLHAYRASRSDLAGYVPPTRRHHDHGHDCDRHHPGDRAGR